MNKSMKRLTIFLVLTFLMANVLQLVYFHSNPYYDAEGNLAEYPHDYTHIELDSSQKDRMEQKKKDFYKKYQI